MEQIDNGMEPEQRRRIAEYEKRKASKIAARRRELYIEQQERTRRPVAPRSGSRRPMSSPVATQPQGAPCPHWRGKWLAEIEKNVAKGMTHSTAVAQVSRERPALVSCVRIEARRLRGRMTPQEEYTELLEVYQRQGGLTQREAAERIRQEHPDLSESIRAGSGR